MSKACIPVRCKMYWQQVEITYLVECMRKIEARAQQELTPELVDEYRVITQRLQALL